MIVNGLFKSVNDKEMESMAYKIAIVDDEEVSTEIDNVSKIIKH